MMKSQPLSSKEKSRLFAITAAMPLKIEKLISSLSLEELTKRPESGFSLHEHVWHLADLEIEGFKIRLEKILQEHRPKLINFDGDKVAADRDYHSLPLMQALKQFSQARLTNLWLLSGVQHADWIRSGYFESTGDIRLVDVFRGMAEHDLDHLNEIEALLGINHFFVSNFSSTAAA